MLLSVFSYAASIFWVKKVNANIEPVAQATGSILVSTLAAICIVPFIWQHAPQQLPDLKTCLALLYTVIMASLIAMFCYFKLVQKIQPTTLSSDYRYDADDCFIYRCGTESEKLSVMVILGAVVLLSGLVVYFYKDLQASRTLAQN